MPQPKDLFDDSVMTFGEHLEVLRFHLVRAILGLAIGVAITLVLGERVVVMIREPIDQALRRYALKANHADLPQPLVVDNVQGFDFFSTVGGWLKRSFMPSEAPPEPPKKEASIGGPVDAGRVATLELSAYQLLEQLHAADPDRYPAPPESLKEKRIVVDAASNEFGTFRKAIARIDQPVTLQVQEAFMTYLKVAFIAGLILSSPWVFYQIWLFVAAGLYPHERKYVYIYLPMSLFLFIGGAAFCFYGVFPTVLDFLLEFNLRMGLNAQIRISEWINFAVLMPLMFGISFQLPLVMLFLQKLSIVDVKVYREQWRLATLAIAFLSMLLTPTPDPMSMLLMMAPLMALYFLGIGLCTWTQEKPVADTAAV